MLSACQLRVVVQILGRNGAAPVAGQLPLAFWVALGNVAQALAQVALNGAYIHAKLLRQQVLVQATALVQQRQDMRQALGQFFSFGAGWVVGRVVHGCYCVGR